MLLANRGVRGCNRETGSGTTKRGAGMRGRTSVAAIAAAMATVWGCAGTAGAATAQQTVVPRPGLPAGAVVTGALPGSQQVSVAVALAPQSESALQTFATEVSTPGSSEFHQYLTVPEFRAQFAPSDAQIAAVRSTLAAAGLSVGAVSPSGLLIDASGTAAQISQAFSTSLSRVQLAGGQVAYTNTIPATLPTSIASTVQTVVGLNTLAGPVLPAATRHRRAVRTPARRALGAPLSSAFHLQAQAGATGPQPCSAIPSSSHTFTADQLASAYGFKALYTQGDLGAGTTVALIELAPYAPADITAYQNCYGTSASVTNTNVDGGPPNAGTDNDADGSYEDVGDIEDVIGLAPDAAIHVYLAPNNTNQNFLDVISAPINADSAQVISSSWDSLCDAGTDPQAQAEDTVLAEAAVQGQSFFNDAGDWGSDSCYEENGTTGNAPETDVTAGLDFATVVGGTTLPSSAKPLAETTWNHSDNATGGGVSATDVMPAYQTGAKASLHVIGPDSSGTPCGAPTGQYCREEPDVAADSDPTTGYDFYYAGAWGDGYGGTSYATPLWAALAALADSSSACQAAAPIGFANPALYELAGTDYSTYFNDVTTGDNDAYGTQNGLYPAGTGYDLTTGLGTPKGTALAAGLCADAAPQVSGLSPSSGPLAGGTSVTITGAGFRTGATVSFGTMAASNVVVVSSSEITATAPAVGTAGPGTRNVLVSTAAGTSAKVAADQFTYTGPAVSKVSPSSGPLAGGTAVTITGAGFTSGASVAFGTVAATNVQVVSSTKITATSPKGLSPGARNVLVTTSAGTSAKVAGDQFTYVATS
jgi:subtilase family serine protease